MDSVPKIVIPGARLRQRLRRGPVRRVEAAKQRRRKCKCESICARKGNPGPEVRKQKSEIRTGKRFPTSDLRLLVSGTGSPSPRASAAAPRSAGDDKLVSSIQTDVLRLLAAHRDLYVAGALPLNRAAPRISDDIDVFHDREERIAAAEMADTQTLAAVGCEVAWLR